jgi:hypothetical protein
MKIIRPCHINPVWYLWDIGIICSIFFAILMLSIIVAWDTYCMESWTIYISKLALFESSEVLWANEIKFKCLLILFTAFMGVFFSIPFTHFQFLPLIVGKSSHSLVETIYLLNYQKKKNCQCLFKVNKMTKMTIIIYLFFSIRPI